MAGGTKAFKAISPKTLGTTHFTSPKVSFKVPNIKTSIKGGALKPVSIKVKNKGIGLP